MEKRHAQKVEAAKGHAFDLLLIGDSITQSLESNAGTGNARASTPEEIAEGIRQVLLRLRAKSPSSKIVLMGFTPHNVVIGSGARP